MKYLIFIVFAVCSPCYCDPETNDDSVDIFPYAFYAMRDLFFRRVAGRFDTYQKADDNHVSSVCFDELGCFDKNGTFKHLKQLPDTPENIGTMFLLYTRKNKHIPQIIDYKKPGSVADSNFNAKLPVKFIAHGFGGKDNITWVWNMKDAFLKTEDMNVICVYWTKGAAIPNYMNAVVNAELVGAQVAVMTFVLMDMGLRRENIHFIGFSLGAHVCGFAGKRMELLRHMKPARITGLDPASPLYEDYGEYVHLHKGDADFVDIIHTNADKMLYGGVGMLSPVGHVDYYPNGGKRQPGCSSTLTGLLKDIFKDTRGRACNHERAAHLFTESILKPSSCRFMGYRCNSFKEFEQAKCFLCDKESCGEMGYYNKGHGSYYFLTKGINPYCADNVRLTVEFSKQNKKSYGKITAMLIGHDDYHENVTMTEDDEKLTPGESVTAAAALDLRMRPLKEVIIIYDRYNGWISKGTRTFSIASIKIHDLKGELVFSSCDEKLLEDAEEKSFLPTTTKC